jgi:hypothetical protein
MVKKYGLFGRGKKLKFILTSRSCLLAARCFSFSTVLKKVGGNSSLNFILFYKVYLVGHIPEGNFFIKFLLKK